jgi:Na+/H+-dicarboxylate symporter
LSAWSGEFSASLKILGDIFPRLIRRRAPLVFLTVAIGIVAAVDSRARRTDMPIAAVTGMKPPDAAM